MSYSQRLAVLESFQVLPPNKFGDVVIRITPPKGRTVDIDVGHFGTRAGMAAQGLEADRVAAIRSDDE